MELSGGNKFKWVKKHGHEDAGYLLFTSRVYFSVSFFFIHPSFHHRLSRTRGDYHSCFRAKAGLRPGRVTLVKTTVSTDVR